MRDASFAVNARSWGTTSAVKTSGDNSPAAVSKIITIPAPPSNWSLMFRARSGTNVSQNRGNSDRSFFDSTSDPLCERSTDKTNQTLIGRKTLTRSPHRIALEQKVRPGFFNRTQLCQGRFIQVPAQLWSVVAIFQTHAQGFQREKQIAKQNGCV